MDTSFDLLYFAFCASFTFPSFSLACLFAYLMVFLFCCRCCVDIHQTLLTKTVFIWNLYVIQRFPACVCSVLLLLSLRFCMFACVFIPRLFCFVSIKASFVDQLFFLFCVLVVVFVCMLQLFVFVFTVSNVSYQMFCTLANVRKYIYLCLMYIVSSVVVFVDVYFSLPLTSR